jgi:serine/threonine protein kinase
VGEGAFADRTVGVGRGWVPADVVGIIVPVGAAVKVRAGDQFGEWRVLDPLGKGGNGQVWRVEHVVRGEQAAIKVLDTRNADSERYARFRSEVETLEELADSELAILPLLDKFLPEDIRNNPAWYVMPLAKPLAEALAGQPVPRLVEAMAGIAETLAQLASLPLHHRDVKPDNLYERDGRAEVGDFGLIKRPKATARAVTSEGKRPGPYAFMPSEAFLRPDEADDEAIDVYCLAMCLWAIAADEVEPPRHSIEPGGHYGLGKLHPEQPHIDELDEILAAATAADPAARPRMAELAAAFERWVAGLEASSGYAAEYAALERNKRLLLRWLVEYAHTVECFFGMNMISATQQDMPLPPGLSWPEVSAAFASLYEDGLIRATDPAERPSQPGAPPSFWMNVYPSPFGVEKVLDKAVLIARLAPLLRSLPRHDGYRMQLSRRDTTPDGFDDWKLPPAEYVFLMRQAQAYDLADFSENAATGYIWLSNIRLTSRGLQLLAELEQPDVR